MSANAREISSSRRAPSYNPRPTNVVNLNSSRWFTASVTVERVAEALLPTDLINKIRAYALQDEGADTIEANQKLGLDVDLRRYEQCAEILRDLGILRVRVMSNNPQKIQALEAMGLIVEERVTLPIVPKDAAKNYLRTKKQKMGHLLEV